MKKLAVIGAGMISYTHADAIKNIPDAVLCAVSDIDETAAKKLAEENGCKYFTDAEKMLREVELDAVIICVPTFLHEKYVSLCAIHGVNVLCEKPVAMTVEEAERIQQTVKDTGIFFMVGQVVRFWTGYTEIKEMADAGELGEVYMAFASRRSVFPWRKTWIFDPKQGGGPMHDMHVHDIDYLRYLLGPMDYVYCHASKGPSGYWDHVMTSIAYKNGQKAVAEACFTMQDGYPFSFNLNVAAAKATIELNYSAGITINQRDSQKCEMKIYRKGKEPIKKQPELYDAYKKELEYYLDCLERQVEPERVPYSQNLEVIKAVCAIEKSAETNEIIKL